MAAVASRYARALVEVVLEQKIDTDIARQQLHSIVEAVHESPDLRKVWESPAVSPEQKRAVLDGYRPQIGAVRSRFATSLRCSSITGAWGCWTTSSGNSKLSSIRSLGLRSRRFPARVRCRRESSATVEKRVERMTGKKVRARYISNPELLGGVMVRVGQHDL